MASKTGLGCPVTRGKIARKCKVNDEVVDIGQGIEWMTAMRTEHTIYEKILRILGLLIIWRGIDYRNKPSEDRSSGKT